MCFAVACLTLGGCVGGGADNRVVADYDGGVLDAGAASDASPPDAAMQVDSGEVACPAGVDRVQTPLRINELTADNDGNWIDEVGETDDWIELVNVGATAIELSDYGIADATGVRVALPPGRLGPGQRKLLWADDTAAQGSGHLPFKLSATADRLELRRGECEIADEVEIERLGTNEALARFPDGSGPFSRCRYASPLQDNGATCEPQPRVQPAIREYAPYAFPDGFAAPPGPLVINELALAPAAFIELLNVSDTPQALGDYELALAPTAPGLAWPIRGEGTVLGAGTETLQPGERTTVTIDAADVAELAGDPLFEGVATLFSTRDATTVDRVDFMRWPTGAVLARVPDATGPLRYCENATEQEPNDACQPLASRDVGDRVRHLRTPGDYPALAEGAARLGMEAVKFVLDMQAGDVVHLLSSRDWALHYTFVREVIDEEPALDRCDAAQNTEFYAGWVAFSQVQYGPPAGRRYVLGTLTHHGASDLNALEFTSGNGLSSDQIRHAFFAVMPHVLHPRSWAYRPQGSRQAALAAGLEGQLPMIDEQLPFADVQYQPLTQTVGYGVLEFVPEGELQSAALGARTIVVTDDVPNDIPLVGGLVTEAFQTPLAHVNVLSQSRDTPNMALRDAREDPSIAAHLGELVRFEVGAGGFTIELADPLEAESFWAARAPQGGPRAPHLDTSLRGVQDLSTLGYEALAAIGGKAAQLAELPHVVGVRDGCPGALATPAGAFALPVVHSLEHQVASGAQALLESLWADPTMHGDPAARRARLAKVRAAIQSHPVDPGLLAELTEAIRLRYGDARVRLRSSSNTEDLPDFSGAGIYTSYGAAIGDPERTVEDALRGVWASLWNDRAYDERELSGVDHRLVAMGVLVHPAYLSERARGVAVSRNVLDPIRGDMVYLNSQAGEASVTNPAPGVQTEELIYRWPPRSPEVSTVGMSSLTGGDPVLSRDEAHAVACAVAAVHAHFKPLLDPVNEDRLFAMEIEFKLLGDDRRLLVKQARPHSFRSFDVPADCREF